MNIFRTLTFMYLLLNLGACGKYKVNLRKGDKCFDNVYFSQIKAMQSKTFLVYTGSNFNTVGIKDTMIATGRGKKTWVKKRADANCLSSNPDDCMVWCLIEDAEQIYIVKDTTQIKEFSLKKVLTPTIIREANWQLIDVVCPEKLTTENITEIQEALIDNDYYVERNGKIDKHFYQAIQQFQIDKHIGIGMITLETLEKLNLLGLKNKVLKN